MPKDTPKVKFHKKEMNLLEAIVYLVGLELGIVKVKIDEEDMYSYNKWKNEQYIKNRKIKGAGGKKEGIPKKLDERKYLIDELKSQIRYTKNAKAKMYCKEYGHKEMKGSSNVSYSFGRTRAHVLCSRCNTMYERKPTEKELGNPNKGIQNPFRG